MIEDQIPEDVLRGISLRECIDDGQWLEAVRTVTRAKEDFRERKSLPRGGPSSTTRGEKRKFTDSKRKVAAKCVNKRYLAKEKAEYQKNRRGKEG